MKHLGKSFSRILILLLLAAAGYYTYTRLSPQLLSSLSGQVSGLTTSLPVKINTGQLADNAKKKFVDSQPILDSSQSPQNTEVLGVSTQELSAQAQSLAASATEAIKQEIQNLPKQQAAQIVRQTCDQIISELEK